MDEIMEKNLKTFADWFMQQQSEYSRLLEENSEMREELELWHDKTEQIEAWKDLYVQQIKFKSFKRAMNEKNRDSTDILFKIDKRYSDKVDANVKAEVSLVWIAKAVQQKRIDRENGK